MLSNDNEKILIMNVNNCCYDELTYVDKLDLVGYFVERIIQEQTKLNKQFNDNSALVLLNYLNTTLLLKIQASIVDFDKKVQEQTLLLVQYLFSKYFKIMETYLILMISISLQ